MNELCTKALREGSLVCNTIALFRASQQLLQSNSRLTLPGARQACSPNKGLSCWLAALNHSRAKRRIVEEEFGHGVVGAFHSAVSHSLLFADSAPFDLLFPLVALG